MHVVVGTQEDGAAANGRARFTRAAIGAIALSGVDHGRPTTHSKAEESACPHHEPGHHSDPFLIMAAQLCSGGHRLDLPAIGAPTTSDEKPDKPP